VQIIATAETDSIVEPINFDAKDSDSGKRAPEASVIIVNHNGRAHLESCLRSLVFDDPQDYEIIVVDNVSSDGSADHVEWAFPSVRVIRNRINGGFGQGSNLGARCARGEYLAFLNPDTVAKPGWLSVLVLALKDRPWAGLATPKILLLSDPRRINTCGNMLHLTGLTLCRGMNLGRDAFAECEKISAISGAAFVVRRELFNALGGFDESFFLYMEDTDLSYRARLAGFECLYVPSAVVFHDYALRFGPSKTFLQERNRYLMLLKAMRWRSLLVLLPALIVAEFLTWGFVLLKERTQFRGKLRAYFWIARHWDHVLRLRRRVQAMRKRDDRELLAQSAHRLSFEQTGDGVIVLLARLMFNPTFFVLHRVSLALIRW
jgi:GT2 family glycosyltransferase